MLEFHSVRGLFHVPAQLFQHALGLALHEADHPVHERPVVDVRHGADTGGDAAIDVVVETRPGIGSCDLLCAQDVREHPVQRIHRASHRAGVAERAKVARAIGRDPAGDLDPRPLFLEGYANVGIVLVVAEDDVELRPLLLDEVGLPLQRLQR